MGGRATPRDPRGYFIGLGCTTGGCHVSGAGVDAVQNPSPPRMSESESSEEARIAARRACGGGGACWRAAARGGCRRGCGSSNLYSHKGFFSVNAQCVVASNRQVLSVSTIAAGASHDATAWAASQLGRDIAAGLMPDQFCIVGDDAYSAASPQIVTPYPGAQEASCRRSRTRSTIG